MSTRGWRAARRAAYGAGMNRRSFIRRIPAKAAAGSRCAVLILSAALVLSACGETGGDASAPPAGTAGEDRGPAARPILPDSVLARLAPQQRGTAGRWRKARPSAEDLSARIEELESIGYAAGSRTGPEDTGVLRYDPEAAWGGLNFYTSGHDAGAVLMDMDGTVRHRWRYAFADAWPEHVPEKRNISTEFWRRARLFPDGDVVAIYEGLGILRVDANSNLRWAVHNNAHHDFDVTPDGELVVLTRTGHIVERVSPKHPVLEDFVSYLDAETGEETRRISLLEAFERGGPEHSWAAAYQAFWEKEHNRDLSDSDPGDLFHTNAVEWLDGSLASRAPGFRRGRLLLSMRNLDAIAVLDPDTETIVWSMAGAFTLQHEPTVTAGGRVLVFDNHWQPNRWSRIVAVDPAAGTLETIYAGSPETPFYSHSCGSVASLPNGNALVTESDNGRAFEVTPSGEIVWEFYNPHRAGDSREYIATLFQMTRLPADFPTGWAGESN